VNANRSPTAERDIAWHPERLVDKLDPDRKVAVFSDGPRCLSTCSWGAPPPGPAELIAADKAEFGTNRIQRWFDRRWDHARKSPSEPSGVRVKRRPA
jgi:hypothetical protein